MLKFAALTSNNKINDSLAFMLRYAGNMANPAQNTIAIIAATLPASGAKVTKESVENTIKGMPDLQQQTVINILRNLPTNADVFVKLKTIAIEYAKLKWPPPPEPPAEPALQCPFEYGYKPCTDPAFNEPFNPGAAQVINDYIRSQLDPTHKTYDAASKLCCKFTNLGADLRPEVQSQINANRKFFTIFTIVMEVILSLVAAPGLNMVLRSTFTTAAGTTDAVLLNMTSIGLDTVLSMTATSAGLDGLMAGATFTNCNKAKGNPGSWKTGPHRVDKLVFQKDNEKHMQLYTVGQGQDQCPIIFGGDEFMEYSHQVGRAIQAATKSAKDGLDLTNFDADKLEMLPFNKWTPGYKGFPPISCMPKCVVDKWTGSCKCASCRNWDETGMECRACDRVEGDGTWKCGQYWDNPEIIGGGWTNGFGTHRIGNGHVDRSTL